LSTKAARIAQDVLLPAAGILGALLIWDLAVRLLRLPGFLLPSPGAVLDTALGFGGNWSKHFWATARATFLGFGVAIVVGMSLAVAIVHMHVLRRILTPLILVLQIVPKVAFAPLLLIWFGSGTIPIVVIAFLVAFFPMVVNTSIGLEQVEPDLLDLTRSFRMSRWRVLWLIRMPTALPYIFSGLRVASTLAVIGVIIGEFVGSNVGLGYLILIANSNMNTSLAIASIILISAFGLLLYGAIVLFERLAMPWKPVDSVLSEAKL
jgi:NitT/TauT family transport system permease protein